jgi:hypothetical protein
LPGDLTILALVARALVNLVSFTGVSIDFSASQPTAQPTALCRLPAELFGLSFSSFFLSASF